MFGMTKMEEEVPKMENLQGSHLEQNKMVQLILMLMENFMMKMEM